MTTEPEMVDETASMPHQADVEPLHSEELDEVEEVEEPVELDEVVVQTTRLAAQALVDKKASDIRILNVQGRTSICDTLVLATGSHARHVSALATGVIKSWKDARGGRPLGVEGTETGRWVLIDLGDTVVHLFDGPMRGHYDLDGLWVDAGQITLEELGIDAPEPDEDDFHEYDDLL